MEKYREQNIELDEKHEFHSGNYSFRDLINQTDRFEDCDIRIVNGEETYNLINTGGGFMEVPKIVYDYYVDFSKEFSMFIEINGHQMVVTTHGIRAKKCETSRKRKKEIIKKYGREFYHKLMYSYVLTFRKYEKPYYYDLESVDENEFEKFLD